MNPHKPLSLLAGLALFAASPPAHSQTLIDDDFTGGDPVTDWLSMGNTRTFSAHNITQTGGLLTTEIVATQTTVNRGIGSVASFDPSAGAAGFTMTFVVDSVSISPNTNGFFIGIARKNTAFYRDADADNFGLTFFGNDSRTVSGGGFGLNSDDVSSPGAPADRRFANSDAQGDVQLASFLDGFTATVSADPAGWSYEIIGLNDAAGTETTFSDSGGWGTVSFADLFGADDTWHVATSMQRGAVSTWAVVFDRITVLGGSGAGDAPFQIISVVLDESNEADPLATVAWASRQGEEYSLEVSTDLAGWAEVEDSIPSGGETTEAVHHFLPFYADLVGARELFYRVLRQGN